MTWHKVCSLKKHGGLNIISLREWNQTTMIKLLWNLCGKVDSLWIKWIHSYYIKKYNIWFVTIRSICSWIMKAVLMQRINLQQNQTWQRMLQDPNFYTRKVYHNLKMPQQTVPWRKMVSNSIARSRAIFIVWLACQDRLSTKERLHRFGFIDNDSCIFCDQQENLQHLFFQCLKMKNIWKKVFDWL